MNRYNIYRKETHKFIGSINAIDEFDAVWRACSDSGADPNNYYARIAG